ncbi:hypothetical protein AX16_002834 [Volvariella volvacea WC 439]|nr:hypothetical protein AX16_002834 [Volvariella volvacea WC 439]
MAPSYPLASPTFSATSSSFDMVSSFTSAGSVRSSQWVSDEIDTDEIVYSPRGSYTWSPVSSDGADNSAGSDSDAVEYGSGDARDDISIAASDDFVVLSRSQSPVVSVPNSTSALSPSHTTSSTHTTASLASLSLREQLPAQVSGKLPNVRQTPEPCVVENVNNSTAGCLEASTRVNSAPTSPSSSSRRRRNRRKATVPALVRTDLSDSSSTSSDSTSPPGTPQQLSRPASVVTLGGKTPKQQEQPLSVDAPKSKRRARRSKRKATAQNKSVPTTGARSGAVKPSCKDNDYTSMYDEAVNYITSFLMNPPETKDSSCHLTLLQSLIIELGLATDTLPASLTAARSLLKSKAFLNVKEYLATRNQGPDAIQHVMYPSRSALIRSIKKNKNYASKKWVKEHGLQVLLVSCYH